MTPLRYIMVDEYSLQKYESGEDFDLPFVKKSLALTMARKNVGLPSHYIDAEEVKDMQSMLTLKDLLTDGLVSLASQYLLIDANDEVHVKLEMMNEWQQLLADFSPLILVSSMIWYKHKDDTDKNDDNMWLEHISKSIKYTALPDVSINTLENLREEGLVDIHIHVNEMMESDRAWLFCLSNPDSVIHQISKKDPNFNCKELSKYLSAAISVNEMLGGHLLFGYRFKKIASLFDDNRSDKWSNPIDCLKIIDATELQKSSLYIIKILCSIKESTLGYTAVKYFHLYLLLMGYVRRYMVMQLQNIGIEQFNMALHFPARIETLADGLSLKQICGKKLNNVSKIEARFDYSSVHFYQEILSAKDMLWKECRSKIEVSFTPYFVKYREQKSDFDSDIRYAGFYHGMRKEIANFERYRKHIQGVDVAGKDFYMRPETFAPMFDDLRNFIGVKHFTYHVAEDFFHVLTGLRTIYEAVCFLHLKSDDRLSHVSAAGIDPKLWIGNIGDTIPMPKGMYLDDLIFVRSFVRERQIKKIKKLCIKEISSRIKTLSQEIYGVSYNIESLEEAWKLREKNPYYIDDERGVAELPKHIYKQYQSKEVRKKYEEIIEIPCLEYLSLDNLISLQNEIMHYLQEKNIVVEILPTCNVYIGHHKSFQTYHLQRWLNLKYKPRFVVGSDEPGVFSTNIYNEYCNLYCMMLNKGYTKGRAEKTLKGLADNTRKLAF